MYQYLYAIADRLPAAWRPPEISVGGPVALRRLGNLAVVTCDLELAPMANARMARPAVAARYPGNDPDGM